MADESTFDLVEREIQRAEALLARDSTAVRNGNPEWTPSKGRNIPDRPRLPEERRRELLANLRAERNGQGEDRGEPSEVSDENPLLESFILRGGAKQNESMTEDRKQKAPTPDDSNRYKDRTSRNALIERLLLERKTKKDGSGSQAGDDESSSASSPGNVSVASSRSSRGGPRVKSGKKKKLKTPSSIRVKRSGSVVIEFDGGAPADTTGSSSKANVSSASLRSAYKHQSRVGETPQSQRAKTLLPGSYNARPEPAPEPIAAKPARTNKRGNDGSIRAFQAPASFASSKHTVGASSVATGKKTRKAKKTFGTATSRPFARKTKEDVEREMEEKLNEECTFKPKINPVRQTSKIAHETREQRLARLAEDGQARIARREQARIAKEQEERSKCTFKPRTNDVYITRKDGVVNWARVRETGRGKESLQDRLHHEADERAMTREHMKRRLEEEEMSSFPFKPMVNPRSHAILNMNAYKPIHERVDDLQKAKRVSLQKKRLQREQNNPDLTFRPKISTQSRQIAQSRALATSHDGTLSNVTQRLVQDAEEKIDRSMNRKRAWEEEQKKIYTFQPRVNDTSRAIVANAGGEDQSFLVRQVALAERSAARERHLRLRAMKENECTFKPDVGNATAVLQHTRPQRLRESSLERVERLSVQDRQSNDKRKAAAEENYYKQFSHHPEINVISQSLARSKTIDELTSTERETKKKEKLRRQHEQHMDEVCTFEPELSGSRVAKTMRDRVATNPSRPTMSDPETIIDRINRQKQRQELKIEEIRHKRQYDAGQQCTFNPTINRKRVKQPQGPVTVKGFGRFLELKELAKKLENEKSARENRAFMVSNAKYRRGNKTIPKPFKLSGDNRMKRLKELERKVRKEEMRECTFIPKTTETNNRRLLTEILADDSDLDFEVVDSMLDGYDDELVV